MSVSPRLTPAQASCDSRLMAAGEVACPDHLAGALRPRIGAQNRARDRAVPFHPRREQSVRWPLRTVAFALSRVKL